MSRRRAQAEARAPRAGSARPRPSRFRSGRRARHRPSQDLELARRRRQHASSPSTPESILVTGDEEDRVHLTKLVPRQGVVITARPELSANGCDRSLTGLVDVRERPALRSLAGDRPDLDTAQLELLADRRPSSSSPSTVNSSASSASRASWIAATPPPPPACSQSSIECAMSPGPGIRVTRQKRIHSTCPTTATASHERQSHRSARAARSQG